MLLLRIEAVATSRTSQGSATAHCGRRCSQERPHPNGTPRYASLFRSLLPDAPSQRPEPRNTTRNRICVILYIYGGSSLPPSCALVARRVSHKAGRPRGVYVPRGCFRRGGIRCRSRLPRCARQLRRFRGRRRPGARTADSSEGLLPSRIGALSHPAVDDDESFAALAASLLSQELLAPEGVVVFRASARSSAGFSRRSASRLWRSSNPSADDHRAREGRQLESPKEDHHL